MRGAVSNHFKIITGVYLVLLRGIVTGVCLAMLHGPLEIEWGVLRILLSALGNRFQIFAVVYSDALR